MALPVNFGPFFGTPGSPFAVGPRGIGIANGPGVAGGAGGAGGSGGGNLQPGALISFSSKVIVNSKFSANPGVLVSGRRPDRPGS